MALNTTTLTGSFSAFNNSPASGAVLITPTSAVVDSAGSLVLAATSITAQLSTVGTFSVPNLVTTDNAGLQPPGWAYTINIAVGGAAQTFAAFVPYTGSPIDISTLIPAQSVTSVPNQMVSGVTVTGYPSVGDTLIATSATTAIWGKPS